MSSGFEEWKIISKRDNTLYFGQDYSQYSISIGNKCIPLYHLEYTCSQDPITQKINVIGEIFHLMEEARKDGRKFEIVADLSDLLTGTNISLVGLSHKLPEIETSLLKCSLEQNLSRR